LQHGAAMISDAMDGVGDEPVGTPHTRPRPPWRATTIANAMCTFYAASWSRSNVSGGMPWLAATQIITV
jgi:hypothetical protein